MRDWIAPNKPYILEQIDHIHCVRQSDAAEKAAQFLCQGFIIGMLDKIPFGAAMNKGLTFRMGQTHVQHYMQPLLKKIVQGKIDPSKIITHRIKLKNAPDAYKTFNE